MKVAILFVFVVVIFKTVFSSSECLTPNGEKAICKTIADCPVILTALLAQDDLAKRFYEDSKCGGVGSEVCCGEKGNYTTLPSTLADLPKEAVHIPEVLKDFWNMSVCGIQGDPSVYKIRQGERTGLDEFPWVAALEYKRRSSNETGLIQCGGSIINRRYILTAAHCVVNYEFDIIKAWLGVWNISSAENCAHNPDGTKNCTNSIEKFNIEKTIPHKDFNQTRGLNDIALLRLDKEIKFNKYISPICLPSPDLPSPERALVTVAGWGLTENNTPSDVKLKVALAVRPKSICEKEFANMDITGSHVCAGGEHEKDTCKGDSGGPLMKEFKNINNIMQWYQEGIVSYGKDCTDTVHPSVYTRVAKYIAWIKDNTLRGSPCTTPHGKTGTCVAIDTCQVVFNAMSSRNASDIDFAKNSRCGYDMEDLVCCESPGSVILADSGTLQDKKVCGLVKEKPRIVGGKITALGEFPWNAILEYKYTKSNKTWLENGGSLINNRYVMVTASRLDNGFKPIRVWLGDWNISTGPDCIELTANKECADPVQKLNIKEQILHPFYDRKYRYNNIGLLRLENDVEFTDYIKPICLPTANLPAPEVGALMILTGWGETENRSFTVFPNEVCNSQYNGSLPIRQQQFCAAGRSEEHPCWTDDGHPLMRVYEDKLNDQMQWYQHGILTTALLRCFTDYPRPYTLVSSYINWITKVISEE